jgi:hypothetical protein
MVFDNVVIGSQIYLVIISKEQLLIITLIWERSHFWDASHEYYLMLICPIIQLYFAFLNFLLFHP